jgi:hypothetical protein
MIFKFLFYKKPNLFENLREKTTFKEQFIDTSLNLFRFTKWCSFLLITLTDTGTIVSGQADNGANHIIATIYAFWFILGDAIVGFLYTDVILSGPGGSNIVFQL